MDTKARCFVSRVAEGFQEGDGGVCEPDATADEPRAGFPRLHPYAPEAVANPDVMFRSMSICLAADICEKLRRNLKFDLVKAEFHR
jgi:hypothetical protein